MSDNNYYRRDFLKTIGGVTLGASLIGRPRLSQAAPAVARTNRRRRLALVGTGVRGTGMFGRNVLATYSDYVEFVGLCDINPGRVKYAKQALGTDAPTYTDLEEMLKAEQPEQLIVTSRDDKHHEHIIAGMKYGCDIICEKPLTIDEQKAQAIIEAEKEYDKQVIVTFNYRYPPYRAKIKELLVDGWIGDVSTVDFHWNITHSHLMRYMQRWHGQRAYGGSLWVHKSTHHFDMVNWFLDSDPVEVYAEASLDRFGKNGPFRGKHCRDCRFAEQCPYHWDITRSRHLMGLYVNNEHYDGYIRDNCVFRETIDVFDRHSALVKYANGAYMNYSLTGDVEHEGYWLAFNGTKGRIEIRMGGGHGRDYEEIKFMPNARYSDREEEVIQVGHGTGGHWGGDPIMTDQLFKEPDRPDPLRQQAGVRDGVMSVLVGVAARKSVDSGKPVKIEGLTELVPLAKRPV